MKYELKNFIKKNDKGSISIFLFMVLSLFVFVAAILIEYSFILFQFQKETTNLYLDLDQAMSDFHRPLFMEMGLFAVESDVKDKFFDPLYHSKVLEQSIMELMDQKLLLDGVKSVESIVNDFVKEKAKIKVELFDINELNSELQVVINEGIQGILKHDRLAAFITKLVTMKPYVELHGLDFSIVKFFLEEGKFSELKELNPVFVLKRSIRKQYQSLKDSLKKYDVVNVLGRYELADYAIGYLGYSGTKEQPKRCMSEFLLTRIQDKGIQSAIIKGELYSLRFMLNYAECLTNPVVRQRIMKWSFGSSKLFALESLAICAIESGFDVNDIVHRRKIPLRKGEQGFQVYKVGFLDYVDGLTYPEYLKIMLMIMPRPLYFSNLKLAIENNYDIDLHHCYTEVCDKRTVTIKGKLLPFECSRVIQGRLSFVKGID